MLRTNTLTVPARFITPSLDDDQIYAFAWRIESECGSVDVDYDKLADEELLIITESSVDTETGKGEVFDFLTDNEIPFDLEIQAVEHGARDYEQWRYGRDEFEIGERYARIRGFSDIDKAAALDELLSSLKTVIKDQQNTRKELVETVNDFEATHSNLIVPAEELASLNWRIARDDASPAERDGMQQIQAKLTDPDLDAGMG